MKIIDELNSIPLGKRYSLGWRVIGMIFSMYLTLEFLSRGLGFIGQSVRAAGGWKMPINEVAIVWIFLIGFLVVVPPVASIFLGFFFPLDRLVSRDEGEA